MPALYESIKVALCLREVDEGCSMNGFLWRNYDLCKEIRWFFFFLRDYSNLFFLWL